MDVIENDPQDQVIAPEEERLFLEESDKDKKIRGYRLEMVRGKIAKDEVAAEHFSKALTIAQELNDQQKQIPALIGLGNARCSDRVGCYIKALKLLEQFKNTELEIKAHMGLANAYAFQKNDEEAMKHFKIAIKLANMANDRKPENINLITKAHMNLAVSYSYRKNDEEAIYHYKMVIKLTDTINDRKFKNPDLEIEAHMGLGRAYACLGNN